MGELGVLFNPGMRHEQEEKLAKQMLREDEGTGRKGRLGIDLESGVVVIGALSDDPAAEPEVDAKAGRTDAANNGHADAADTRDSGDEDPTERTTRTPAAAVSTGAGSAGAARKPQPGEARSARLAAKEAPSGKAKRKSSVSAAPDAPVGKSRRRGH